MEVLVACDDTFKINYPISKREIPTQQEKGAVSTDGETKYVTLELSNIEELGSWEM